VGVVNENHQHGEGPCVCVCRSCGEDSGEGPAVGMVNKNHQHGEGPCVYVCVSQGAFVSVSDAGVRWSCTAWTKLASS
jgi:hypothetical protein